MKRERPRKEFQALRTLLNVVAQGLKERESLLERTRVHPGSGAKRSLRRQRRRSGKVLDALIHLTEVEHLVLRSVYHELANIVEHEIHKAALPAWDEYRSRLWDDYRTNHPAPANAGLESAEFQKWRCKAPRDTRVADVSEVFFPQLRRLIEDYYEIKVTDLEGERSIRRIREVVNDLKHRRGRIDPAKRTDVVRRDFVRLRLHYTYRAILRTEAFVLAPRQATR
jgi:hypothetical protein